MICKRLSVVWRCATVCSFLFCIQLSSFAQQREYALKIVDSTGIGIPYVSVKLKDGKILGATNDVGEFNAKADAGAVLQFSSVSYDPANVILGDKPFLTVPLHPKTGGLEDVVIVGYGKQKRANVTGSIAILDGKALESRPISNTIAGLQGQVPGLTVTRTNGQPGKEGWTMQMRGATSTNGADVLVVIDGVPGGSMTYLNPDDVESISVLKDAAAASIYGANAAGGVILVTTKSGSSKKTTVQYSGIYSANKQGFMPKLTHSWEQAEMANEARLNAGLSATYTDQQIEWFKSDSVEFQVNASNAHLYDYYDDFNQLDYLTRNTSFSTNQNISVSGGNEKTQYLYSVGYFGQQGIFNVGPDNTKRYNARINLTSQFSKYLSLSSKVAYIYTNTLYPTYGTNGANDDYGLLYLLTQIRTSNPIYVPGTSYYANTQNTAYARLKDGGQNNDKINEINGVFTLNSSNIAKGLTASITYSPRITFYNRFNNNPTVPLYNDPTTIGTYLNTTNSVYKYRYQQTYNTLQGQIDYDWNLGLKHHFHVLGGYSQQSYRYDYMYAGAKSLSTNTLYSLNYGTATSNVEGDAINTYGLLSYFGRFNYNYDNRLLLEFIIRDDGSSRLDPNNRWHIFPSVSVGYRLENEPWFNSLTGNFFQAFKPRVSWGKIANSSVLGYYDYLSLITVGNTEPFNGATNKSYYNATLGSPNKTWEVVDSRNIGLDISAFNNRLTFTGDYYVKKNESMLATPTVSSIIGITLGDYNIAALKTWGWELNIGYKDHIGKLQYSVNANLADSKNKVTKYASASTVSSGVNSIIEGMPVNSMFVYEDEGYFQSADEVSSHAYQGSTTGMGDIKYKDLNGDGNINAGNGTMANHGDLKYVGNTSPRYTYGFNIALSYKAFDFSAMLQGVGERKILLYSDVRVPFVDSWRQPWEIHKDYWTEDNRNAKFPRLYSGGSTNIWNSTHWVQNAAYLRVKNMQLGYTIKNEKMKKKGITSMRIYFTGQDMFELINKMWFKYFDPENPNNVGYEYPMFRTYAAGLNITF